MTPEFAAFIADATADPAVVGLVLKGSRAHDGMTTRHSDHDVYVILADDAASEPAALDGYRSARLDLAVTTLERFRRPADWERYAIARSRVLVDRSDGEVTRIVGAMGRLGAEEAFRSGAAPLDAVARITATGEVAPQQRLFAQVETAARAAGHAALLDAWGEDLLLMRLHLQG